MGAETPFSPQNERVLAAALDAASVLVVVLDRDARPSYFNQAVCELTGYTREELEDMSILQRVAPEDQHDAFAILEGLWHGHVPRARIVHWVAKDGRRLPIEWRFSVMRNPDGVVTHVVAVGLDITERHALEVARAAAEERFRLAFDGAPVGMEITRAAAGDRGVILAANDAMCRMLGYGRDELVGRTVADVTHPDDVARENRWTSDWIAEGAKGVFQYEKRYITSSGATRWGSVHLSRISSEPGGDFFLVHVLDITDRRQARETPVEAVVDPLTGLSTEPAFLRELRVTLAEVHPLSVLRLQLLTLGEVQAVHGHVAAERLVCRASADLVAALPDGAQLARTGRDEFATFLEATGRESLDVAYHVLSPAADEAGDGDWPEAPIAFAAGVAAVGPGEQDDADSLYVSAGVALEDAVRAGTGAALSDPDVRDRAARRLRWAARLREGPDEAGLLLFGQPVMRLSTGTVEFTELSLRLRDDDGRLVYPSMFLPAAESTGRIIDIDRWLLRHAIDLLHRHPDRRFAIRLSAATVMNRVAAETATAMLEANRDAAERLIVEVTGADAPIGLRRTARQLRRCGCELLLLNFGLAFGSLQHARTLPISALKIHGSLVRDAQEDERDRAVLTAVAGLARLLGVITVAELVETAEAAEMLRRSGVDCAQGFFFARPQPLE